MRSLPVTSPFAVITTAVLAASMLSLFGQFRPGGPRQREAIELPPGEVAITVQGDKRVIESNGIPKHEPGQFPTRGNPNPIRPLNYKFEVPAEPKESPEITPVERQPFGIALNGVPFDPGTAEYWDPSSRRGMSRNRSSGWNLEGMGNASQLGMDKNNAHVDGRGPYHYHGVPAGLLAVTQGSHIGYAADGFEIHYIGARAKSGYRLKPGTRAGGPGGRHDGTYVEDWEYVGGSGKLDRCNGGMLNGKYVYFATDTFPFFPRCLWGSASSDFRR